MKKSKLISIFAIVLSCVMLLVACQPSPVGGGTTPTKKPKDGDICIDLDIKKMPTKLTYNEGEKFNPAGLMFDAVYQNGFDGDTGLIGADLDGFKPTGPLSADVNQIELIFEGFSKFIDVTVLPKKLLGMEITREPDIRSYFVGDALDLSGLVVKATYEEGEVDSELNYTVTDKNGKTYKQGDIIEDALGATEMTVTVKSGDVQKSDTFDIAVYRGLTLQAEDYVAVGDEPPTDRSYTVLTGKAVSELVKDDCTFTGTGYIGNISKGVIIEFNIYTEQAIENADLVLIASSTCQGDGKMEDMQFNKLYRAYIDYGEGYEEIYFDNDIVIEGKPYPPANSGGNKWTNWADVPFVRVDLPQGYTKVKVECIGSIKDSSNNARTPNVDRLDVRAVDGDTEVTRGDYVTALEIKNNPAKLSYKEGETVDLTGLVFDVEYRNGYEGDKDLGPDRITSYSPSGALTSSDTKLTIKFKNATRDIDITVAEKQITGITIERNPDILSYAVGDRLSLVGMIVKATLDDGSSKTVTDYTVKDGTGKLYGSGTKLDTEGETELIVEYRSRTATFKINVVSGITVQAEDFLADGEQAPTNRSYTVFTRGDARIKEDQGSGSGDKAMCIENITPGNATTDATKIEFYIYSETAMPSADLVFTMASSNNRSGNYGTKMEDVQFNKMFKVTLGEGDGEELFINDGVIVQGRDKQSGLSQWFLWTEVNVGKIDLVAGFNKVTLECIGQIKCADGANRAANVDCLTVRANSDENISGKALRSVSVVKARTYYEKNAKFTFKGMLVQAEYEGGVTANDVHNFVVKDADGKEYHEGDALGADKRDIELFAEITDGTEVKRGAFTIHVAADSQIRVEAENTTVSETSSYTVINGTIGDNKDCKINSNVANASGKAVVESINKIGLTIDFMVYSENAVNDATVVLNASTLDRGSGYNFDVRFDKLFELYIDDVKVDVGDAVIHGRETNGDKGWFLFTDNELCKVNLKAGFTKITLKVVGKVKDTNDGSDRISNIDSLDIRY